MTVLYVRQSLYTEISSGRTFYCQNLMPNCFNQNHSWVRIYNNTTSGKLNCFQTPQFSLATSKPNQDLPAFWNVYIVMRKCFHSHLIIRNIICQKDIIAPFCV